MKDKERKKQKNSGKKPKKKMKLWKKVLIVILLVLLVAGGWFIYKTQKNGGGIAGMLATVVGHDEFTKKNLPEIKVLVLGVSNGIDAKLTDTIMVASYNPKTQKGTLLSIPRDTYVGSNTKSATAGNKINAIYGISQDPKKVLDKVNEITNLDIKYYVVIETNALRELVDSIGGVTFDVPIDMNYDDEGQKLAIHIKKGEQVLNGEQAEGVVRFRHNNNGTSYPVEYGDNDLGRMKTQREFIKAVAKQTIKLENILKIGQWVDIFEKHVKSNIDFNVVKDYIPYGVEFNVEDLLTATLPGTTPNMNTTNNISIFVVNKTETKKMIQELFVDRDIVDEEENDDTTETDKISIELLNGTGNAKTLESVAEKLKNAGYKVTKKEQTNTTSKTTIINKKDVEQTQLEKVKNELGVGTMQNSKATSSKVDITIILGKDYK
ncbi:MAG: LCP family protein [Clostridia bacterium]|nr:LCP family protein [Clostridia bacterium]